MQLEVLQIPERKLCIKIEFKETQTTFLQLFISF